MPSPDGSGGYLLYVSQNTLFGAAFDPDKLELRGAAVPLLDDLAAGGIGARSVAGQFDVSRTGTLAYLRGTAAGGAAFPMMVMDSAGKTAPVLAQPGAYSMPRFSPDGKRIAYVLGSEVWDYDLERRTPTQLTFTKSPKGELAWSPDGKHLLYGGGAEMWWIRADGGGQPQRLLDKRTSVRVFSTAPGGRVAFRSGLEGIETLTLDLKDPENPKPGQVELFRKDSVFRVDAAFSPQGNFIAYASNEAGAQEEIYVEPFPGPGGKWKISTGGGKFPAWSKAAHELLFLGGDNRIMAASYTTQGDAFSPATPRVWSPTPVRRLGVQLSFDVAPDGKHVVMFPIAAKPEESGDVHITFLLNFADELKRRLGTGLVKP
jgi:serine/threonine-protein kinase